jgi:hypothetical protein
MEGTALAISIPCPRCQRVLPVESLAEDEAQCPWCGTASVVRLYPAAYALRSTAEDSRPLGEEAACYFHEDRVAVYECSRCGRFLCRLCSISWPGGEICRACMEAALEEPAARHMESERFHWDSLALAVAIWPALLFSPSLLSAPMALGLAVFTFRKPCSLVPRSKIRFIAAIVLAISEIVGWVWLFTMMYRRSTGRL